MPSTTVLIAVLRISLVPTGRGQMPHMYPYDIDRIHMNTQGYTTPVGYVIMFATAQVLISVTVQGPAVLLHCMRGC